MSHSPSKAVPIYFLQFIFHVFIFALFSPLQTTFSDMPQRELKERAPAEIDASVQPWIFDSQGLTEEVS
jgi:hypothetical protein